jgi:hypothetical protein
MRLSSFFGFFYAIYGANLDTETTYCAAPLINIVIFTISDNRIFRANEAAIVA